MNSKNCLLLILLVSVINTLSSHTVGMIIVATGKYHIFVKGLVESARKFFLPGHEKFFFVFTDQEIQQDHDIIKCYHERVGWPFDTLVRHHVSHRYRHVLSSMDYLYYCDADTLFSGEIGDEILGDLVGAQAFYHINNQQPYDIQRNSIAFVPEEKRKNYCSGSFYGGKSSEYLKMVKQLVKEVEQDWQNGFFATHHDESYLNHYFSDYQHFKLSPYCVVDCDWYAHLPRKILQVEKDFSAMRFIESPQAQTQHDQWWFDQFSSQAEKMLRDFGGVDAASRKWVREHVIKSGFKTILDVGSGYGMDFFGYKKESPDIHYQGVEIIPYMVSLTRLMGAPVIEGSIEQLPFQDKQFQVVYARNLCEYLPTLDKALNEMVRVASSEVIVTVSKKRFDKELSDQELYDLKSAFENYCVKSSAIGVYQIYKGCKDELIFIIKLSRR